MRRRSLSTHDRELGFGLKDSRAVQMKPKHVFRPTDNPARLAEFSVAWDVANLLRRTGPLTIGEISRRSAYPPFTIKMGLDARPEWFAEIDGRVSVSAAYLEFQREASK